MRPKDPRAVLISSGEIDGKLRESRGHLKISPPGMEMGQQIKTLGAKEKRMDSRSLATNETYQKFQRVEYMIVCPAKAGMFSKS